MNVYIAALYDIMIVDELSSRSYTSKFEARTLQQRCPTSLMRLVFAQLNAVTFSLFAYLCFKIFYKELTMNRYPLASFSIPWTYKSKPVCSSSICNFRSRFFGLGADLSVLVISDV